MDKKLVIIPTYNERENIEDIVRAVMNLDGHFHVLVIDDGSPDGTAGMVKSLQTTYPERLHLVERSGKLGLGTAYLAGFRWALKRDYGLVFEMDADFSHNPQDLLRLYDACKDGGEADLAVGSRYCNGVSVVDWPMSRILMSYCASAYVRTILGVKIYDTTAGFVCYRREVLQEMNLDDVRMKGYGFQIEMKYTASALGFRIKEVPIIFTNRQKGKSKMSGGIFGEAFWGVIALRFRKFCRA